MKIRYALLCALFIYSPIFILGNPNYTIKEGLTSKEDIIQTVENLSNKCWEYREKYPDSAMMFGLEALKIANENELYGKIGKVSNYIGVVYMHYMYRYKEAIPFLQKAMRNSIIAKDSIQMAYAFNNLGDVYLITGNIPLALQYGEICLDIFKKIDDEKGISYSLINLAEVYREKKEFQKSLDYFQEAYNIRYTLNTPARMGYVLFDQARTYEQMGNYEVAINLYQQSIDSFEESNDYRYISWCLNGYANISYANNDHDKAIIYYKKALQWNIKRNHTFGMIDNYIGLALIHAHNNEEKDGLELLNKARDLALDLDINSQIINSYNSFIEFYKILGDYENVIESFDLFLVRYDSILSNQQFEIVNQLENSFLIRQELIRTEEELNTNILQERRLMSIIIIMVIVMIVLIWLYISNRRLNQQLIEINKTKDKLFSVISHDLKNPFNSLLGYSELLPGIIDSGNYEQAKIFSGYLHKASVEGFTLLTNLLNWSLSQSGKIHFSPEVIDFNEFFKDLDEFFQMDSQPAARCAT